MIKVREFKRTFNNYVLYIFIILISSIIGSEIRLITELASSGLDQFISNVAEFIFWIIILVILLAIEIILTNVIIPPDFEYLIKVNDEYIIFEMSEEDHRRINRDFNIAKKTRKYMVLDDGTSRIRIAYNKEVLHFLKRNQKSS